MDIENNCFCRFVLLQYFAVHVLITFKLFVKGRKAVIQFFKTFNSF